MQLINTTITERYTGIKAQTIFSGDGKYIVLETMPSSGEIETNVFEALTSEVEMDGLKILRVNHHVNVASYSNNGPETFGYILDVHIDYVKKYKRKYGIV